MNPSFPGSSGDRHGPTPPPPLGSGANSGLGGKSGQPSHGPPHGFHPQPSLSQLTHPSHHGSGIHPLHGGGGHSAHSSILHAGPHPLAPPPLTQSLGQSNSGRSPHHSLPGSILHPPRGGLSGSGPGAPSVLSKPPGAGMGPPGSQGQSSGVPFGSHQVRLPPQGMSQGMSQSMSSNPNSLASAPSAMKPGQPFARPGSPPRRDVGPQGNQQQQQQQQQQAQQQQQQQQQPQIHYVMERTDPDGDGYYGNAQSGMGGAPRHRELRVEDALLYLDQVKQQFGDQPDIYNQFLDVMKDFKAQAIDTPGVILRVSSLFRGYPNLILGFNTFLPPGYRIRPDTSIEVTAQQVPGRAVNAPTSMFSAGLPSVTQASVGPVHRPPPVTIPPPAYAPAELQGSVHHAAAVKQPTPSRQPLAPAPSQSKASGQGKQSSSKKAAQQQQQQQQQQQLAPGPSASGGPSAAGSGGAARNSSNPVEFDHAIHYVTTIKQRFADEPETYKEFLAILHTYQKEQRSIRQVLDQVSYLFRDHPDLLREFTFFLPDAVQDQAKERLNHAAEKAQQRKDQLAAAKYANSRDFAIQSAHLAGSGHHHHHAGSVRRDDGSGRGMRPGSDSPLGGAGGKGGSRLDDAHSLGGGDDALVRGGKTSKSAREAMKSEPRGASPHDDARLSAKQLERREKERERERNKALFASKRAKRRAYDGKERRAYLALSDVLLDREEWGIFEKIKKVLPSRESWREFLKCLELYSQEVLRRDEMLALVRNLFGRHRDLVDEFDALLGSHGAQPSAKEIWPFIPLAETDLSQCRRATPSYRALPASYPIPPCSYRSQLERAVCNDSWVSVPTGSEDFSFKNMRKNQYEEALFKCEDERFEIDMVIDANASTIVVLEPLAREIEALRDAAASDGSDDKLWRYVVDKGTFRVTHLNAISRIYGDAGAQILDLLRKYPAGAIPVILKRLQQKDAEWRRARQDLNTQWKDVNEQNYHKSLDHSSFYFKQKDKKQTSMKVLLQEAKKKLEKTTAAGAGAGSDDVAVASVATSNALSVTGQQQQQAPPEASDIADALRKEHAATPTSKPWQPHFAFPLASVQVHKDTFGLLSYAAEKNLSVADKEKVSKLWSAFFFPFFGLDEEWLTRKPKRTAVSVERAKSLRAGTEVSTDFGDGTVQAYDAARGVHIVDLPIGQAYLQPESITIQEASDLPPGLDALDDARAALALKPQRTTTFFGSQHAYGFVRLYAMLHSRLARALELCEKAKRNRYRRTINPAARALAHARHTLAHDDDGVGSEKTGDYPAFLTKLYALIDGSIDSTKYEDACRSLMGSTSYFLFTLDKLVSLVLKQMQQLANDDTSLELLKVFAEAQQQQAQLDASATADAKTVETSVDDAVAAYLSKTKAVFEGDGAFRLAFHRGILRRTPVEARSGSGALTPMASSSGEFKIWAPSPRVKSAEPSQWLVEPELAIEYLGSLDDDNNDDDNNDDDDESPAATPPETPSATPLFGSPTREPAAAAMVTDELVRDDVAAGVPDGDNSDDDDAMSDDDDDDDDGATAGRKDPAVLKKRARSASEDAGDDDANSVTDAAAATKKAKTDEAHDGELEDGEETGEESVEEDGGAARPDSSAARPDSGDGAPAAVTDADDPMTGSGDANSSSNSSNSTTDSAAATTKTATTTASSVHDDDGDDEEEEDEAFGGKSDASHEGQREENANEQQDGGAASAKPSDKEGGEANASERADGDKVAASGTEGAN